MTLSVFLLVLLAAAFHAGWNAILKGSADKTVSALAIAVASAVIALCMLPFLRQPAPESWPHLALSTLFQTAYLILVAAAYRRADMSLVYPVMRGGTPLIVAMLSVLVFGEHLSLIAWGGVSLISAGILTLAFGRHGVGSRAGLGYAFLNTLVIAGYTINDGAGVRASGSPAGYTLWLALLTIPPVLGITLWRRGRGVLVQVARVWRDGLIGATGSLASYGVALWAMTLAPVAVVAALRETSVLFATAISALILHEQVGWRRILSVVIIATGAMLLRLA